MGRAAAARKSQIEAPAAEASERLSFRRVDAMIPYANNARKHSADQIAKIRRSIEVFGWTNAVLADDADGLAAGHGRLIAASSIYAEGKRIAMPDGTLVPDGCIPVLDCTGWDDAKRRAYILADNEIPQHAQWDHELLAFELDELRDAKFDLPVIGFDPQELNDLIGTAKTPPPTASYYSQKIEPPVYEPTTERAPAVSTLLDDSKTRSLVQEIDSADLPAEVATFLRAAAERHTAFNFRNIAEFYAHASAPIQALMERSALVIIDFDAAIENGFVKLTDHISGLVEREKGAGDA